MPIGIQVWGEGGAFVQIDSNYRSLRMTAKNTIQSAQFAKYMGGDKQWWNASVDVYGDYPIVGFRSNSYTFAIPTYISQGHYVWTFVSEGAGPLGQTAPSPLTWWVFNELLPNPSNFGFQIKRDDGVVVFDANDKAAKVADFWTYTGNILNVGQNVQRSIGSSWAVAPCQCSTTTSKNPINGQQITLAYAVSTIGTQFTLIGLRPYIGAFTPMGAVTSAIFNPSYVFLDVAGY